jgi:hypothetical protein
MDSTIYLTLWAVLAFVSWLIVVGGAVLAVFSRAIKDTTSSVSALPPSA